MHRLFFNSIGLSQEKITISDLAEIHHAKNVLRLKIGQIFNACDEKGNTYAVKIDKISEGEIILAVLEKVKTPEKKFYLAIACALPKNCKFDDIIDKLTQLGVDRIIPLKTRRVILKLDKGKEEHRLARWKKIALSAACQSQRNVLPEIQPIQSWGQFLAKSSGYDLKIIPTLLRPILSDGLACGFLPQKRLLLKELVKQKKASSAVIAIGPEGDFTDEEVRSAAASGFIPVSLGDLVLRVDTAAIAAAGFINFFYADR